MPIKTVLLSATRDTVDKPILWRLGKLFNVVTNIRRARVTEDSARVKVDIEGSTEEVAQALGYLRALGLYEEGRPEPGALTQTSMPPETTVPRPNTIQARITAVQSAQARYPILYRLGKDYDVVVHIERAAFDEEETPPGWIDVALSGPLAEIQRAIAYLHTTGVHVNPRQRSVTDYSNL